ncbi:serine protease [Leptospira kobayashii]|uniref:Serine protease n=1 Tax=Leptospira kobayashii TaxID=1917830 RepID=A0ABM7UTK8_9LEPT|nr:S1C family serine protease [Leptospira kobayashii]BDA80418.1 serine protease [Leptospira kobayashii]
MNKSFSIHLILFFSCIFVAGLSAQEDPSVDTIFRSVVLIRSEGFATENKIQPWMKKNLSTGLGSGLVISKNTILTNAHVVMDAKRITVRTGASKKEYSANVKFIGYDCDLALLEVTEQGFAENTGSLSFAEAYPALGSDLLVLGFPNGQENLTVEKGSVLRLEKNRYSFSGLDFRNVIKINSNILPGNSGGPAVQDGKVVGLVFQISKVGRDVAYLIPNDIIQHFLTDVIDGKYDGFPSLGFTFQSGSPVSLKQVLKIPVEESGIFLNRVYPNSTFSNTLKEKDFLVSLDGLSVTADGELKQQGVMVSLVDYIESKQLGNKISFELYRSGKKYQAEATLQKNFSLDLYREVTDNYLQEAGLVFQPVSRSFFNSEDGDLDSSLKYHYSYFIQDILYRYTNRDIVLSFIFEDSETAKYKKYKFKVLESLNGIVPKDLNDLKKIWKDNAKTFIVLRFRGMDLPIILNPESVNGINVRVKKRYGAGYEE